MVCAISLKGSCQLAQVILNAARKYLPEHACPPFCTCSRIPKWVLHRLNYPPTQADYLSFFNEQTEKAILSPTDCPSLDLHLNNISSSNETTVTFTISRDFWMAINIASSSSSAWYFLHQLFVFCPLTASAYDFEEESIFSNRAKELLYL